MKRLRPLVSLGLALAFALALAGCAPGGAAPAAASPSPAPQSAAPAADETTPSPSTAADPAPSPEDAAGGGILVAYFSNTGNTEEVAQQIAGLTGGTLAEIQRAEPYGDLRQEAEAEIQNGERPAITVSVDNVEDYDTIFVGYPIWWDEAPAMIATFLESYDFSGKMLIPFCTSASDSIDNSLHIFSELCPDAAIAQGLTANDPDDVEPWLQGLGLPA